MQKTATIYTVSQINTLIRKIIEDNLPSKLTVKGEISDLKIHSSGHCYFSLKDENSILPCAMWKHNLSKVKFKLENGLEVLTTGSIDVYIPRGNYKLIAEEFVPAGFGALQLAFEQMKKKLQAEGLFEDSRKKAIPKYPQRIGILTSPTGAAVHDIKDSIHSRWPCVKLFLYPVPVQGEGTAEKIAVAIHDINKRNSKFKLDILIIGRGGGSLEDLWTFNEEILARAIFKSKIPVISAVGHEVDITIADMVADARASTPTKAGVVAVPDMRDILSQLKNAEQRLTANTKSRIQISKQFLQNILVRTFFREPMTIVMNAEQQVDELSTDLSTSIKELLTDAGRKISRAYEQISRIEPHRLLGGNRDILNDCRNRLNSGIIKIINAYRVKLTAQENRLAGMNPKSVLKRGYSITSNKKTGELIRTMQDIKIGDLLITELAEENLIESQVTKK